MPRTELGLITQPASTTSHLFDEEVSDPDGSDRSDDEDVYEKKERDIIKVQGPIAGRAPVSSGAFGLVQGVDSNIGAGMRLAAFRGLKEIGLGFVESIYDDAGGDFDLPTGASLSLKYKEQKFESGSRYIKEDDVRKACDEAFRREGREVVWIETTGVSEVGNGIGGTLPIGELAEASADLKLSGIIRYRRLEPYESASGTLLAGQALADAVNVPITASLARRMPAGAEFEFTGEGNLSFKPELVKPLGLENGVGSAGATAKLGAACSLKGETTISVQRLPFGDEVLVKIGHGKSAHASIGAAFKAGLKLKSGSYETVPELGRGLLKFALERLGLPDVPQFIKRFMQSQLYMKSREELNKSEVARYVFDLSKPAARKAYEDIFCRLSLGSAQSLVQTNEGSVWTQKAGETVRVSERGAAAILGQTKLLLFSALQAERDGKVSVDGRSEILYRDCKFEKTYANWISGEKKIKWEAVTVANPDKKASQRYFHLSYTNNDRITESSEIQQFLRFAQSLGLKTKLGSDLESVNPDSAAQVLADRDDTQTSTDIYFTSEGLEKLSTVEKEEARTAYFRAHSDLSDQAPLKSSPSLERYAQLSNKWFFIRIFHWGEMSRLKSDYEKIAPQRNISEDARLLNEADDFASCLAMMKGKDDKSAEQFFMNLGKASGFEFMKKMAALMSLATSNHTIIHDLSISGGGLTLGAVDEGEILHPEKAMHRMLTQIA